MHPDPFAAQATMELGGSAARVVRLGALTAGGAAAPERLPYSIRMLLESVLRNAGDGVVTEEHVRAVAAWEPRAEGRAEIPFMPARVLLQDFTGVPCVVDLAAMRAA